MGIIQKSTKNLSEALGYYQRALKLYEALDNSPGIAHCYNYIAEVHYLQEDVDLAMQMLAKSLDAQRKIGDAYGLVAGLNNQGVLYLHAGNLEEAERSYLESLYFARQIGSLQAIGRILNNLTELHIKRGTCDEAEAYLGQAETVLHHVGDKVSLQKLEEWRMALAKRRLESA